VTAQYPTDDRLPEKPAPCGRYDTEVRRPTLQLPTVGAIISGMRESAGVNADGELLERTQELDLLDGLVERVQSGHPAVALVEGPAGIGKSRLLLATRERAQAAGFRTLAARGSDLERGLPFGVVRQLFEPALVDPQRREQWLSGSAVAAARVFDAAEVGNPSADAGFSVLYGLSWLTANAAADRPLMLAIDDLHWCDRASLRFIAYLVRRLEDLSVLVTATVRDGEPHVDTKMLGEIGQDPAAVSVRPRELSQDAVAELVRQRLGAGADPSFVTVCHQATGGNPLLLHEVLKTMQTDGVRPDALHSEMIRDIGPRAVSRSVLLRLARLHGDAVAVARAVAVLGDGAGLPATAALSGLDEARVARATRSLAAAEILRPESPLGFVHPLVRDAVYLDLVPAERALQHEHAANVLIELGAAPDLIAAHLLRVPCRSDRWVATLLHDAGLAAMRRADAESAVAYLRRALAEPPPADRRTSLLLDLGTAEALANEKAAAAEHLKLGYAGISDPLDRATTAETLARVLLFTGPASEAAAVARQAAGELPEGLADVRWRLEALELFSVNLGADIADTVARLEAARVGLRGEGVGARMLAAVAAADWATSGGSAPECCELATAALADGVLVAADPAPMGTIAGGVLDLAGLDQALTMYETASAEAHRSGSMMALSGIYVCQGVAWLARGELAEAEAALRRANGVADPWRSAPAEISYGAAFMARVLIERGDLPGARDLLARQPPMPPGSDADGIAWHAEAELLIAERHWAEALTAADRYRDTLRDRVVNPAWAPWRSLRAQALSGLQRQDEAIEMLEQELLRARNWGAAGPVARVLRLLGTIGREGPLDTLREAVEVAEESTARLERAKALVALGSALRRGRKPSAAREPLRRGLELALQCGAPAVADQARTELYASGGRPKRDALTGPDSLTPSERRIAQLAAEGQGNREIAQALYITPKTVEFHLTSVYRKLGINARVGLTEILKRAAPA
jgi:DNA-binding CsgD family transcriptional regulator